MYGRRWKNLNICKSDDHIEHATIAEQMGVSNEIWNPFLDERSAREHGTVCCVQVLVVVYYVLCTVLCVSLITHNQHV